MYNADLEFSTNVTLHHILAGVTERDTVRYRIFWASKIGFLRSILEVRGDRPLVELPGAYLGRKLVFLMAAQYIPLITGFRGLPRRASRNSVAMES